MYSGFPGLSLNRDLERGVTAIGGFRSDPYLDKGYRGVQLSPTQGGIPANKMVIGQYTYNSPIRGQGSQNYFVVADVPQPPPAPPPPAPAPVPAKPADTPLTPAENQYTPKISELEKQLAAEPTPSVNWETRYADLQKNLEANQAAYNKQIEQMQIASQKQLADLIAASGLQIKGLETQMSEQAAASGLQIKGLETQMSEQVAAGQAALAQKQQEYEQGLGQKQQEYEQGLAKKQQEYDKGLAALSANQQAFQINQARASQGASMQIQPATTGGATKGGTAAFKRRPRMADLTISGQTNLNIPTANVLNI